MARHLKLRLLIPVLPVILAVALVACGAIDGVAQVASPTATAPPSLEAAPSPTAAARATNGTYIADTPEFPQVTPPVEMAEPPPLVPEDLKIVWEAWQLLNKDYVDRSKLDPEAFSEEAIRGMLKVLEDNQTGYVSPELLIGSFQDVFHGEFEGIGAYVDMNRAGKLIIVSPIEGGPAEAAGLRPGDIVIEVNGESLEGLSSLEAVAMIRGPKGTVVTLLVKHLGAIDPVMINVTRGVIPLVSVYLRSKPGAKFAHIRISDFYPNTVGYLRDTILEVVDEGAKGLILDLRGNPGGTLDAAVDIASEFLEDGLVAYDIRGDGRRTEWMVREGGIAKDMPMVVLVNEFSASSSEILVGALQDHNRATVIGATTFGKGSVNILRPLSNGGGLYITIAHWYTPLGRLIQNEGIEPDIEVVARDARDADVKQLERAIQELESMTGVKEAENLSS